MYSAIIAGRVTEPEHCKGAVFSVRCLIATRNANKQFLHILIPKDEQDIVAGDGAGVVNGVKRLLGRQRVDHEAAAALQAKKINERSEKISELSLELGKLLELQTAK